MLNALAIVVIGLLAYTWLVYPAWVLWLGKRRRGTSFPVGATSPSTWRQEDGDVRPAMGAGDAGLPHVAILFSAHNEEAVIEQRLANLAAVDYPADRMHIHLGVDGGTDRTAMLAQAWASSHPNVTVIAAEQNHGKMAMLKRLVVLTGSGVGGRGSDETPNAQHSTPNAEAGRRFPSTLDPRPSILVFTDANTMFEPDALRRLVAPFADPAVGGVCGRLVLEHGAAGKTDERAYWDAESRLKEAESRIDSCLGANGAIYAIRAGLFPGDSPDNTIVDDFVIGMKVREGGRRMAFEPRAVAREELPPAVKDEWRRRVRIGAGAYQALVLCRRCLEPRFGFFAWAFWSHKVLRWFTPHLLMLATILAGVIGWVHGSGFRVQGRSMNGLGVAVAGITVLGAILLWVSAVRPAARLSKIIRLAGYFLAMQAALLVGFMRFCRGGLRGTWERTGRVAGTNSPTPL